jgi:hypothetical protein
VKSIFLGSFALFLLLLPREPWGGAARLHTVSAREWLVRGAPDLAGEGALPGTFVRGGRRWAQAPLGPTLALLPVEAPLLALPRSDAGLRAVRLVEAASAAALAALVVALAFSLCGVSAALLFATTLTVYSRIPDGSMAGALVLLLGVLAARRYAADGARGSALWLGAASGALFFFDLGAATPFILVWALIFAEERRHFGWSLLPCLAGLALSLLWKLPPEPRGDLLEGLDGLLLSTGKSLFAYSPPLLLALPGLWMWWRTRRADALLVLAVAAAVIVPAASLERWDGDPAWGPRRLVPLVPLLIWPAADWLGHAWPRLRALGRSGVTLLVAAGVVVQLLGLAFPAESWLRLSAAVKTSTGAGAWFAHGEHAHYIPQFSPISGHAWMLKNVLRHNKKPDPPPWLLIQPANAHYDAEYQKLRLDWWAARDTVTK